LSVGDGIETTWKNRYESPATAYLSGTLRVVSVSVAYASIDAITVLRS
jgi:hypothetical protein